MSALADHAAAAPAEYDEETKIYPVFTYEGMVIHWEKTSDEDLVRFMPAIRAHAKFLESRGYRTKVDDSDRDDIKLEALFRGESTVMKRHYCKFDSIAVTSDTVWGGGPG